MFKFIKDIKDFFFPPIRLTNEFKWFPVRKNKNFILLEKRRKVLDRGVEKWLICKRNGFPVRKWTSE